MYINSKPKYLIAGERLYRIFFPCLINQGDLVFQMVQPQDGGATTSLDH